MPQTSLMSWVRKPTISPTPPARQESHNAPSQSSENTSFPTEIFHKTTTTVSTTDAPATPTNDDTTTEVTTSTISSSTSTPPAPPLPSSKRSSPTILASAATSNVFRALNPSLTPLPPAVSFARMTASSIPAFKRLNALLLPIPYPQSFYDEILTDPVSAHVTLLAFWDPHASSHSNPSDARAGTQILEEPPEGAILVAGIRCRVYPHPSETMTQGAEEGGKGEAEAKPPILYISTLVLLPSYRSYGIATHLLAQVLSRAIEAYGVTAVTAHVWEANEEGRTWYRARRFEECGLVEGYYRKLRPQEAVLVRRPVKVGDWAGRGG